MFLSNRIEGINYVTLNTSYAIIMSSDKVLLSKAKTGYFLPGGTLENDENYVDCLKRELIEEQGIVPLNPVLIGEDDFYGLSQVKKIYKHLHSKFFFVSEYKYVGMKTEDLESVWISISDIKNMMTLEHQYKAVLECWRINHE